MLNGLPHIVVVVGLLVDLSCTTDHIHECLTYSFSNSSFSRYPLPLLYVGICVYFPVVVIGICAGAIRREQLRIVWWHPVLIGLLFCLHNIFENIGNRGSTVPGGLSLLLGKTVRFSTCPTTVVVRICPYHDPLYVSMLFFLQSPTTFQGGHVFDALR